MGRGTNYWVVMAVESMDEGVSGSVGGWSVDSAALLGCAGG